MFLRLALASLRSRRGSVLLTFLAITLSVFVLLGVEQIRHQTKNSFGNTVSGVDLIVGARTGELNLLLYSVFRLGNATHEISWTSYQKIAADPKIAWTIPIALGDSHNGYRVMGTTREYFDHFRFGQRQPLALAQGKPFVQVYDIVLGSEVARALGYQMGDQIVLSHGIGSTSFSQHLEHPFTVVGILKPTGTPVDQTLHVRLEGIEAIHSGERHGVSPSTKKLMVKQDLTPKTISAFMVGLNSKLSIFQLQRKINSYRGEPLSAILPGVSLSQLWQMMSVMESTLQLISALILLASLLGLAAMLLASIRERQTEISIMRTIGAPPWFLLVLIEFEAFLIVLAASLTAIGLLTLTMTFFAGTLAENFSLFINSTNVIVQSGGYLAIIIISTFILGLIPGVTAYWRALHRQLR